MNNGNNNGIKFQIDDNNSNTLLKYHTVLDFIFDIACV